VLTVSFLFTGVHQLSTQGVAFWILMGRSLLIRVRKLESSGVTMGWVGVCSLVVISVLLGADWGDLCCTIRLVKVFSSLCLSLYGSTIPYTSCLRNYPLIKFSRLTKNR
jgi:hypothetical protein